MRQVCILVGLVLLQIARGQHQESVDFLTADIAIEIDTSTRAVRGKADYTFKGLSKSDSFFLDAHGMSFSSVRLNQKQIRYKYDGKRLTIQKKIKPGKTYQLSLDYIADPRQTVYFIGWEDKRADNNQIWTQGQGKYTSHWVPSFDDMQEKLVFNLSISFDPDYTIIANGKLMGTSTDHGLKTWSYVMSNPMSSYLLAFAAGNYTRQTRVSSSGIPLELYYHPKDSLYAEPTYRYTTRIFDFLEDEIGVAYPWQNYKQVPVRDFLYAGMENTGATIFSESFVIDSIAFKDKNYVNVNAHEMAHQWFGNLVTEKSGDHHWLHEGFASYYAYLAENEIFGPEYYYWRLFDTAKQLSDLEADAKGDALTNPKAGSLTFYEKGAWALVMLRQKLGDADFKTGVKLFLQKYRFRNATIEDFLKEMEDSGSEDLSDFKRKWLDGEDFPFEEVKAYLRQQSDALNTYFELNNELTASAAESEGIIRQYWDKTDSEELKKRIILKYHKSLSSGFLEEAFKSGSLKVRQALSAVVNPIPQELRPSFESLLEDKSYFTIENALYRLWLHFPEGRSTYLNKTRHLIGFPNKNIRLLWLLLAILTPDYLSETEKRNYTKELVGYTSPRYAFEVRQNAFELLHEVQALTDENLKDLINASVHHSWQFRKFARKLLDKLLESERQKLRLQRISEELNDRETTYIKTKLGTK